MEFLQITSADDFRVKEIYDSYCATFPADERRNEKQFRGLFNCTKMKMISVLHDLQNIGYLITWELSGFVFVEHFEIFSEFRSRKYGSDIIQHLFKTYSHIVLEVEPENTSEDAKRRISFYKKNSFAVIDETYVQPPYEEGKNALQLWLLANWKPENTDSVKEEIYDVVYCK